ncbi:MAG: hypothetical protein GX060_02295 [Firmicutes bacterium]|nr:hypothetical protein [Bacillota bacterium]
MLAKLMMLDLRFAYRQFLTMAALLLVIGLAVPYMDVNILRLGVPILLAVAFTIIPVLCITLVIRHFQRNLYGDEGYLMFTLPVGTNQLLLSKVITTLIWFNLMLCSAIVFVFLLLRDQFGIWELVKELLTWDILRKLLHILFIININVLPFILAVFMGISLQSMAVRNRKLGRFWGIAAMLVAIALFVWTTVRLAGWQYLEITVGDQAIISASMAASEKINIAICAAFSAIFFGLNSYIMQRRLNLD